MSKDTIGWTQAIILGVQTVVFIIQTIVFRYQAKMLRRTVDASTEQSRDMKDYIKQATRAADAMEKSAKAATIASENVVVVTERTAQQSRAYLSVQIGTGVYQDANCRFEVKPMLVNNGQTPAYKVKYAARADILPFPLPSEFEFPPLESPRSVFGILAPHHNFIMNAMLQGRCPDNEVEDIKRGQGKRAYIWGTVTYEDAFGKERYTNFAHNIFWLQAPQGDIIFGNYADRHNDAT
jgi:hypothetical protein